MKTYKSIISLIQNERGIWDLDPSKGCASGMAINDRGCYGDCYAARSAKIYGYDFSKTILRYFKSLAHERLIVRQINKIKSSFIRMGCSGDPSENWEHTFSILRKIRKCNKEIVIITKHWTEIPEALLHELSSLNICINTSISVLDESRLELGLSQYERLKPYCKSVLRIVSCDFNKDNITGLRLSKLQDELFKNESTIDTVFRPTKNNPLIIAGIINVKKTKFMNSLVLTSKYNRKTFIGKCESCIEQCGVFKDSLRRKPSFIQSNLF